MRIEEHVLIKGSADRNSAYTLFVNAAQGHYADLFKENGNEKELSELTKRSREEFDRFAQKCFDMGREYERNKSK